jgi:hypothetical protein
MLIIRAEQLQVFTASLRRRFEDRMVLHMRGRATRTAHMPEHEVRGQTREVIELAETHGIDCEDDVQHFLELVFNRWPEARSDIEVTRILDSKALTGPVKVAFVADALDNSRGSEK